MVDGFLEHNGIQWATSRFHFRSIYGPLMDLFVAWSIQGLSSCPSMQLPHCFCRQAHRNACIQQAIGACVRPRHACDRYDDDDMLESMIDLLHPASMYGWIRIRMNSNPDITFYYILIRIRIRIRIQSGWFEFEFAFGCLLRINSKLFS